MACVATLITALTLSALAPLPSDTPPALPVPVSALDSLKTLQDVVNASVMASGARAPANLVLPRLLNSRYVMDFVLAHYPARLRDSSFAQPIAWVFIDRNGNLRESHLVRSSGRTTIDSVALRAIRLARFEPARAGNSIVGLWMPYLVMIGYRQRADRSDPRQNAAPYFTPYTTKPRLLNRDEVRRALVRLYPGELRRLGVSGTTMVWAFVDTGGVVVRTRIKTSSGHAQLDDAAVEIARLMRFSPALDAAGPVNVWIQLPIVFSSGR